MSGGWHELSHVQAPQSAAPAKHGAVCVSDRCVLSSHCHAAQYVFMDNGTYEEHRLGKDSTWADYITEGSGVQLMAWNGKIISVDLPNVVPLRVRA